jgi:PPOX class probable F420-dependent enzyme
MDATAMRKSLAEARLAHLATVGPSGRPHIVPITFVLDGDAIYFAVDSKPKRTTDLQRLRNIAANPAVAVLVDHYDEDWTKLWWVRVDGSARTVSDFAEAVHAVGLLVDRYPQYRSARPTGTVVAISINRISGWSSD